MEQRQYLKDFIRYASLNVLGMVALSCYILADTFFVSQGLGANGLAALNLAIPVYNFIHGSGLMLGMGGAIKYSVYRSQGNFRKTDAVFTNTVTLALGFALCFVCAGLFLSGQIAALLGADSEVFSMTNTYLKVLLLFSPAFLMNDVLICFVRNDGAPRLSMMGMIVGSLSNVVLDYVFIFPFGMGIFGAVLATGLAPVISICVMSAHFIKKRNQFHFQKGRPSLGASGNILSLGVPSLVTEVASGVVIIVFNGILLSLKGNVGVAAYGVIANLSLVVVAIFTGVAQGMQPLVSDAYGRGRKKDSLKFLRLGAVSVTALAAVVYMIVAFWAEPVASVFNSEGNPVLQEIAAGGLRLYFIGAFFAGINIVLVHFFAAVEKAAPAQIISLCRGIFFIIPAAFLLSSALGITGVWLAFPAAELLALLLGLLLYRRNRKVLSLPVSESEI